MKNKPCSVALIRGAFANNFELQNYQPLITSGIDVQAITSLIPIEKNLCIPTHQLPSLYDLTRLNKSPILEKGIRFTANRSFGDAHVLFGLEQYLQNFDILHTADSHYYYSYQAARVKRKFPEKLLISTSWETKAFNNESTPFKKNLKDRVKSSVDIFLCYAKKAQRALLEEHVSEEKIIHLPLGVNTTIFSPSSKKEKIILFVGRLEPEKDPVSVLKAFRIVVRKYPEYKLVIVGAGRLEKLLKDTAADYGIGAKMRIMSAPYHKMPYIYKKAEIFIAPSVTTKTWEEQYGMVFIEAMSSGLPIVTTKSGAIEEVVGSSGLYARERDYVALSAHLIHLISSKEKRQFMGKAARDRVISQFDSRMFANKIQYIYEKRQRNHHR